MQADDFDRSVRIAAFRWLTAPKLVHADILPRAVLERGFEFDGQRVAIVGGEKF